MCPTAHSAAAYQEEEHVAKWVCIKCGSSRVYINATIAINDRHKIVAYGNEFCEHCNGEREIKQVPCNTAEPKHRRKEGAQ